MVAPAAMRKYAQALVRIDAPKGNDPVEVAISLRRGVTLAGKVVSPDDKPVAEGAIITRFNVSGQAGRWGGYLVPVRDGRFVLPGLEPESAPTRCLCMTQNTSGVPRSRFRPRRRATSR